MPLLWLSLAFLSGIVLAERVASSTWVWVSLSLGAILVWLIIRSLSTSQWARLVWRRLPILNRISEVMQKIPIPLFLLLSVLFVGAARFQSNQPIFTPGSVAWYNDRVDTFLLDGLVHDPPDVRDSYINLRVAVDRLQSTQNDLPLPVEGLVLAVVPLGEDWQYGDRLRLIGKLETPPEAEAFSYREYLARQGVYTLVQPTQISLLKADQGNPFRAALYSLKEHLLGTVYRLFPDPEASLMAGILLGNESGIPADVQKAFNKTGTSHVIAISG